jgi:hypothetical protein
MLSIMKSTLLILYCMSMLMGCAQQSSQPPAPQDDIGLSPDFSVEFDRIFLSQKPLRYQDNVAFLKTIQPTELSPVEKNLVKTKLKEFLSAKIENREYAPDSEHTGVASEIAFLRLQTLQILAKVGTKQDIEFIHTLNKNPEGEHPVFAAESEKAIEKLRNR